MSEQMQDARAQLEARIEKALLEGMGTELAFRTGEIEGSARSAARIAAREALALLNTALPVPSERERKLEEALQEIVRRSNMGPPSDPRSPGAHWYNPLVACCAIAKRALHE